MAVKTKKKPVKEEKVKKVVRKKQPLVKIFKCSCPHEYQDEQYGTGMRVHNRTATQIGETYTYRCTVCSSTH